MKNIEAENKKKQCQDDFDYQNKRQEMRDNEYKSKLNRMNNNIYNRGQHLKEFTNNQDEEDPFYVCIYI